MSTQTSERQMKKVGKCAVNHRTRKAVNVTFFAEELNKDITCWLPNYASKIDGNELFIEEKMHFEKLQFFKVNNTETIGDQNKAEQLEDKVNNTETEFVIDIKGVDIKKMLKEFTKEYADDHSEEIIKKVMQPLIESEVQKLKPTLVKIGNRPEVKLEGKLHKSFEQCCFFAQHKRQLFISGPAGSGKTTLGEQVAKAFKLPFYHISCSAGLSEAHLLGRMLFNGEYVSSDFVKAYEEGGLFLFDEIDAADANTLLILNSGLANGIISVPNRKEQPYAKRHKDFICIASANTWGNGSFEYHGRNHLDAAFLDRFVLSKIEIAYDRELEAEIIGSNKELEVFWKIRDNCEKHKVRKVVGTRVFSDGALFIAAGSNMKKLFSTFFLGWSNEEKAKAMEGVSNG